MIGSDPHWSGFFCPNPSMHFIHLHSIHLISHAFSAVVYILSTCISLTVTARESWCFSVLGWWWDDDDETSVMLGWWETEWTATSAGESRTAQQHGELLRRIKGQPCVLKDLRTPLLRMRKPPRSFQNNHRHSNFWYKHTEHLMKVLV